MAVDDTEADIDVLTKFLSVDYDNKLFEIN